MGITVAYTNYSVATLDNRKFPAHLSSPSLHWAYIQTHATIENYERHKILLPSIGSHVFFPFCSLPSNDECASAAVCNTAFLSVQGLHVLMFAVLYPGDGGPWGWRAAPVFVCSHNGTQWYLPHMGHQLAPYGFPWGHQLAPVAGQVGEL
jgi:hypothetical protein